MTVTKALVCQCQSTPNHAGHMEDQKLSRTQKPCSLLGSTEGLSKRASVRDMRLELHRSVIVFLRPYNMVALVLRA